MSARGFTLTELIVGIVILGILAWIAYPKITARDEIKLDAAARRLASDLRYAQSRAIGTRVVHGLWFEPAASRYTVFAPSVASPVTDPSDRARALQVDYARRSEFKGISITSASFGSTRGVTFDYYGVPRDSAGTDLTSTGRVILTYQGLADTVDVAPTTGKVVLR
jgi:prepilin-type N-terminal cleavage/methylation domain-containing protein